MGKPGPQPQVTSEKVLTVFRTLDDPHTPMTASEIATELGCARSTAFEKLSALGEQGRLKTKKVGARGRVWWLPSDTDPGTEIDPDDPLFTGDPIINAPMDDETIDDVLYGETERDADA
jgi:hypothetical protein